MELEPWRKCWRIGFVPQMSERQLTALRVALEMDSPELVQGHTAIPICDGTAACEGACAVGYACWRGDGLVSTFQVYQRFAEVCFEADRLIADPAGCRWFLQWFDDTPREEVRRDLLGEIDAELARRPA